MTTRRTLWRAFERGQGLSEALLWLTGVLLVAALLGFYRLQPAGWALGACLATSALSAVAASASRCGRLYGVRVAADAPSPTRTAAPLHFVGQVAATLCAVGFAALGAAPMHVLGALGS